MGIIEKIFGTHSENELKRIYPIVDRIEALEPEMKSLSDEELRGKTREFKERLGEGETLDDILPEAYAVVSLHTTGLSERTGRQGGQYRHCQRLSGKA